MRWSPSVTVAAVIRQGDRYLVVEECPAGRPVINQPAGHLEFGETLTDAVCREVMEETCRPFRPDGLVGIYQWTLPGTQQTFLRFCFSGQCGGEVDNAVRDADIVATHWLTRDEIAHGTMPPRSPLVLRCIDDALATPPQGLEVLHALD